ncbi:MAG: NimC/NimA family protein [Ruminococcaceae bacterium]|nr:NimC/NimA family protein [Oscillospiraceae bacterium]
MQEVYEFLKKCGTYYLATMEGNQPRVRPFGTIDLYNGRLYIQTGRSKKVADQLKDNGHVELCAFDGQTWVRVAGQIVLDPDIKAQEHMLDAYPSLKAMYAPGDGNTEVYYLKNATATFSSFTAPSRTVEL